MLYKIGTANEIPTIETKFPQGVLDHLYSCTATLDNAYGANRDYDCSGGYSILIDTEEDLKPLKQYVNYEEHPCEWADLLLSNPAYVSLLFLMNDDYSLVVYMPLDITPEHLLNEIN